MFLVGAFSFKGKMPDSYSDLSFLQTTELTLIGPLFTETAQADSGQCKLSAKGPPFVFYFLTLIDLDVFANFQQFGLKILNHYFLHNYAYQRNEL